MEKKNIAGIQNFDKEPLWSNQQTISHTPEKFLIDFKSVNPQFTPDNQATMVISHKVVLLDPHMAKELQRVLSDNIAKYEEKFGEIKIPDAIQKAQKQVPTEKTTSTSERPSYLG